jgi:AraC-like DNA-binding protein
MSGLAERLSLIPNWTPGCRPSGPGPVRFSLEGVPERERPGLFRDFFGCEVARYDIELTPGVPFDIDVRLQAFPGLLMMSGRAHGSRTRRTPRMLAADPTDDVGLVVNLGGDQRITHGERELILAEGEATIISMSEAWSSTHRPPGNILAIRVPRARLRPMVADIDDRCYTVVPRETPALRLLTGYVRLLQDGHGIAGEEARGLVAGHIHDLMALAIGATRDGGEAARCGGLRAARLLAIKRDIETNLDRPDLSLGALAVRHGCTRRFIQRLFEAEGTTLTEYVLARRLARAYRLLADPRRSGEKIAAIALDAGFGDISYFNRAFRQAYGDTPSAVRRAVAPGR